METLTIKTPADVLSFIGHTLGFWPQESLVCITLYTNHIGVTLRVDLPKHDGGERALCANSRQLPSERHQRHQRPVCRLHLDRSGQDKPYATMIAALTGALAERHITIRDGLLIGEETVSQYDGEPNPNCALPLSMVDSSEINAELVYRGSSVARTGRITLPPSNKEATFHAVEDRVKTIEQSRDHGAIEKARTLWAGILEAKTYPSDDQTIALIANLQFAAIRDQLMADIPGVDGPMEKILLAQTPGKPQWARVEWAQQILLHAYTLSSTRWTGAQREPQVATKNISPNPALPRHGHRNPSVLTRLQDAPVYENRRQWTTISPESVAWPRSVAGATRHA
ncbi:DUF4192 family protein [Arthrobacter sp. MMS18-M83]|uniref:DUF4192 family protein n=1 Tax=Arthrobacter sp. MMS18-M83 TaxID=2996261 RepID=UPI00227D5748|nr:DUF4192 family protein [Arthrobacter sp. MMS18-M83]WAH97387.1 DUF4192 family protein [Arthrobacter sp. MMS18-M83]